MPIKLDKLDWKILFYLCQDSRKSHNSIAKQIGTNKNMVTYRVNRLIKIGVVSGFFAVLDLDPLNANYYTFLIKINMEKDRVKDFLQYLKTNDNVSIIDKFLGKWNYLIEFVCKDIRKVFKFIIELQNNFSDILDIYELHPTLKFYRNEQLPVELVESKFIILKATKPVSKVFLNSIEEKLLLELNNDSSLSLIELAKRTNVSTKTVLSKIKKLKKSGIIQKFSAQINLETLGYEVYLILFDLKNLSTEFRRKLKTFLHEKQNIRSAFISASKQKVLIYLAVKQILELQTFIQDFNNEFRGIIQDQEYLLSTDQIKFDLFPKGTLN